MGKLKLLITILLVACFSNSFARASQADSLKVVLKTTLEDTIKVNILISLSGSLLRSDAKEALRYATEAKVLAVFAR